MSLDLDSRLLSLCLLLDCSLWFLADLEPMCCICLNLCLHECCLVSLSLAKAFVLFSIIQHRNHHMRKEGETLYRKVSQGLMLFTPNDPTSKVIIQLSNNIQRLLPACMVGLRYIRLVSACLLFSENDYHNTHTNKDILSSGFNLRLLLYISLCCKI